MKLFRSQIKTETPEDENQRYKPFHETYKIFSFVLTVGFMFPNPKTDRGRLIGIILTYLSMMPAAIVLLADIYNCLKNNDIINVTRHFTIMLPFLFIAGKLVLMHYNRVETKEIIDEISNDYETYNSLPPQYKRIVTRAIKQTKINERTWSITVGSVIVIFPLVALSLNLYECIFKEDPKRYMIHDMPLLIVPPEDRFATPYYELFFVYTLYVCYLFMPSFAGYDGLFGVAVNHACLKIELFCVMLKAALEEKDPKEIMRQMIKVINAQCVAFQFIDKIQKIFNVWLGGIFLGTVVQTCNCMYQVIEGVGIDLRYMVFIFGATVHIYLPCYFAGKIQSTTEETATHFYCCGWENVYDQRIRKMILFMIARGQIPVSVTAFNMITFDMQLFVSVLQTSYSMFTLLRP